MDRDILAEDQLKTNWDQGNFTINMVLEAIDLISQSKTILGADICGDLEWDWHMVQDIKNRRYLKQSIRVYELLIDKIKSAS